MDLSQLSMNEWISSFEYLYMNRYRDLWKNIVIIENHNRTHFLEHETISFNLVFLSSHYFGNPQQIFSNEKCEIQNKNKF